MRAIQSPLMRSSSASSHFYARYGKRLSEMSAQEIIAELSRLDRTELEKVDAQLHELLAEAKRDTKRRQKPIGKVLLEFAGKAEGFPADYSVNLDHYLYGVPKRRP
jgi:hypothetical protein